MGLGDNSTPNEGDFWEAFFHTFGVSDPTYTEDHTSSAASSPNTGNFDLPQAIILLDSEGNPYEPKNEEHFVRMYRTNPLFSEIETAIHKVLLEHIQDGGGDGLFDFHYYGAWSQEEFGDFLDTLVQVAKRLAVSADYYDFLVKLKPSCAFSQSKFVGADNTKSNILSISMSFKFTEDGSGNAPLINNVFKFTLVSKDEFQFAQIEKEIEDRLTKESLDCRVETKPLF